MHSKYVNNREYLILFSYYSPEVVRVNITASNEPYWGSTPYFIVKISAVTLFHLE